MRSAPDAAGTVEAFNDAFNARDLVTLRELLTDECVFEDTTPPDGLRFKGREAVLDAFRAVFAASPDARFASEGTYVGADTVTVLWRYDWGLSSSRDQHVRGIDLFTVRDGLVAGKRSYVKG